MPMSMHPRSHPALCPKLASLLLSHVLSTECIPSLWKRDGDPQVDPWKLTTLTTQAKPSLGCRRGPLGVSAALTMPMPMAVAATE